MSLPLALALLALALLALPHLLYHAVLQACDVRCVRVVAAACRTCRTPQFQGLERDFGIYPLGMTVT